MTVLSVVVLVALLHSAARHLGRSSPPPSKDRLLNTKCLDGYGDPVGIDALRRPLIQYEHAACRMPAERLKLPLAERTALYDGSAGWWSKHYNNWNRDWLLGDSATFPEGSDDPYLVSRDAFTSFMHEWLWVPLWLLQRNPWYQVVAHTPNLKPYTFLLLDDVMDLIHGSGLSPKSDDTKGISQSLEGRGYAISVGGADDSTRWLDNSVKDGLVFNLEPMTMGGARPMLGKTSPPEILKALERHHAPKVFDALKLDLDSFECDILELLIVKGGYRPRVIISEASPGWVPPLKFRMNYNDELDVGIFFSHELTIHQDNFLFYGCSLQYTADLLAPHGYKLMQFAQEDAWFVHSDYDELFFQGPPGQPLEVPDLVHLYRYVAHPGYPSFVSAVSQVCVPSAVVPRLGNPHFYRKVPRHDLWLDSHWSAETAVRWKQEAARCVFRCSYSIGDEGSAECWRNLLHQYNSTVQTQFRDLFTKFNDATGHDLSYEMSIHNDDATLAGASCSWRTSCGRLRDLVSVASETLDGEASLARPCALSSMPFHTPDVSKLELGSVNAAATGLSKSP